MLGEISAESVASDEPMISAIAGYISGDKQGEPGPGFYRAAIALRKLSASSSDEERVIFWGNEVEACYQYFGPRRLHRGTDQRH
jgi:hypothetical protein